MNAPAGLADWLLLFGHFLSLSLLAIGGAMTTAPDMHRFLVDERHWLSPAEFTHCIAIAQAAPGPNILFVPLVGWTIGQQAGGYPLAVLGMAAALVGILLPSTVLTCLGARWGYRHRDARAVRAFKQGMAPLVVALLFAIGWMLAGFGRPAAASWPLWLLTLASALLVWRTRLHLLWLLGAGALLGGLGLV